MGVSRSRRERSPFRTDVNVQRHVLPANKVLTPSIGDVGWKRFGGRGRQRYLIVTASVPIWNCLNRGFTPCKCAVRFGPVCVEVLLFNTGVKRFRAGLVLGGIDLWRSSKD